MAEYKIFLDDNSLSISNKIQNNANLRKIGGGKQENTKYFICFALKQV